MAGNDDQPGAAIDGKAAQGDDRPTADGAVTDQVRLDALRRSGLLRGGRHDRLDRLTALAGSLAGAPVALVSVVDEDRQYFSSQHGLGQPWADRRQTALSHSVCATVVESRSPLALEDLASDPRFADHPARSDLSVAAYCGVPIRDPGGEVLGSFCLIDDRPRAWSPEVIDLLTDLAELVTDIVAANHHLAGLIDDLQRRLLPDTLPTPPLGSLDAIYRPVRFSESVGGDFYDAVARPDGAVDVVVGDVVGHGTGSTQAAAQLRAAARAVFAGATDPSDALNRIAAACDGLPGCDHAALLVATFPADGSCVRFVRAGAVPPVVVGPAGAVVVDDGAGPPLGLRTVHPSATVELALADVDRLLFLTDGLIERRGAPIDDGLDRLALTADADIGLDELVEQVCPLTEQRDDIAIVSWRRAG